MNVLGNISRWLKPGIVVKRWILLGVAGIFLLSYGLGEFVSHKFNIPVYAVLCIVMILLGIAIIAIAFGEGMKALFKFINENNPKVTLDMEKLEDMVYEKRLLIRGPKIVAIGGGTGLSTMLRGLKKYTSNITAIVTVADDGGGSGVLRETLGILPPGDIRNCLLALADTEPLMEELLQYRFTDGMLKDQNFGNLFIAAMNGISGNFEEAIKKMSDVLAVTGKVFPVTLSDVRLFAELQDGTVIKGESKIPNRGEYKDVPIKRVFIKPENAEPLQEALNAIDEADAIILGPGSLYTSIIPNLLVNDIVKHIEESDAVKIYVANIMTQPGETDGYSIGDHIQAIQDCAHGNNRIIDYALVNKSSLPESLYGKYVDDGSKEVVIDRERVEKLGIKIIEDEFLDVSKNLIRHNSERLARVIIELILDDRISKDKKRKIEFYYLNERMKQNGR